MRSKKVQSPLRRTKLEIAKLHMHLSFNAEVLFPTSVSKLHSDRNMKTCTKYIRGCMVYIFERHKSRGNKSE